MIKTKSVYNHNKNSKEFSLKFTLSDLVAGLITSAANKFLIHCVLVSSLSYFEILYATKKKKEENNYSGQRIVYLQ